MKPTKKTLALITATYIIFATTLHAHGEEISLDCETTGYNGYGNPLVKTEHVEATETSAYWSGTDSYYTNSIEHLDNLTITHSYSMTLDKIELSAHVVQLDYTGTKPVFEYTTRMQIDRNTGSYMDPLDGKTLSTGHCVKVQTKKRRF